MSRTKNSMKNLVTAVFGQGLGFIVSFIARYFFIITLGREYLGLNGLFTNILTILSLAELGVGEAITYSLYRPLAENDTEKCTMLMQVYKKIYTVIGIGIFVVGVALVPFLPLIITNPLLVSNFKLSNILKLFNSIFFIIQFYILYLILL